MDQDLLRRRFSIWVLWTLVLAPTLLYSQPTTGPHVASIISTQLAAGTLPLDVVLGQPLPSGLMVSVDEGDGWVRVDARDLQLDGHLVERMKLRRNDAGKVDEVVVALFAKGTEARSHFHRIGDQVCGQDGLGAVRSKRPGPGTPKTDPLTGEVIPLVMVSKARCERSWGSRTMSVRLTRRHDGQSMDNSRLVMTWRMVP